MELEQRLKAIDAILAYAEKSDGDFSLYLGNEDELLYQYMSVTQLKQLRHMIQVSHSIHGDLENLHDSVKLTFNRMVHSYKVIRKWNDEPIPQNT